MTIAPPGNTYPATRSTLSPSQKADKREDEARYAAYLATPEGQAEAAAKARSIEESWAAAEAFLALADPAENGGEGEPSSKKHRKLFAKFLPKKVMGGLDDLLAKVKKKG